MLNGYLGDFAAGRTVRTEFNTADITGAPSAASSVTVKVYKDDATTTEVTTGVTHTEDFDSTTGANHVSVDLSADGAFYAAGADYFIKATGMTVNGVSLPGIVIAQFSIANRSDSAGVTTLLSRLSSARAGYLDNLSAGAVALEASLQGLITTIGASAVGVATAVWGAASRTLSAFGFSVTASSVTDKTGYALVSGYDPAKTAAQAGNAMTLTSGERTAIANEVEAQIIDDTDSEKVLQAITDKIAAVNPDLGGLTVSAIASAVWSAVTRTLTAGTNIVLAKGTGVTGFNDPTAVANASAVRTELATELGRVDAAVSTRATDAGAAAAITSDHGAGSYIRNTEPPTAIQNRAEMDSNSTRLASIDSKTTNLPSDPADQSLIIAATNALASAIAALNNVSASDVLTQINAALDATVADSIPADGARPSVRQAAYIGTQFLLERSVTGTSVSVMKPDGVTPLLTLTLSDADEPSSITRAA